MPTRRLASSGLAGWRPLKQAPSPWHPSNPHHTCNNKSVALIQSGKVQGLQSLTNCTSVTAPSPSIRVLCFFQSLFVVAVVGMWGKERHDYDFAEQGMSMTFDVWRLTFDVWRLTKLSLWRERQAKEAKVSVWREQTTHDYHLTSPSLQCAAHTRGVAGKREGAGLDLRGARIKSALDQKCWNQKHLIKSTLDEKHTLRVRTRWGCQHFEGAKTLRVPRMLHRLTTRKKRVHVHVFGDMHMNTSWTH